METPGWSHRVKVSACIFNISATLFTPVLSYQQDCTGYRSLAQNILQAKYDGLGAYFVQDEVAEYQSEYADNLLVELYDFKIEKDPEPFREQQRRLGIAVEVECDLLKLFY